MQEQGDVVAERLHTYEAPDLVVEYDVSRGIHTKVCVQGLPAVFDPWG